MSQVDATDAYDAIIIGAGLAGLCCAKRLSAEGKRPLVLEASDAVGGRVRTDSVEGFLLDRGFQVLLTSYPEARQQLDYQRLDLHAYEPGALIWCNGRMHRMSDPWRRPQHALATLRSGVGTLRDKLRIAQLASRLSSHRGIDVVANEELITEHALQRWGFSPRVIERFFRPFLGGIFLERQLATSSRQFEFVFRLFGEGQATLPAAGMHAIPTQLAAALPPGTLRLNTPVNAITDDGGVGVGGVGFGQERLQAKLIVVATDGPAADRLLGHEPAAPGRSVACVYFAADAPPLREPILVLNGEGPTAGPINNLSVPSQVAAGYAPAGQSLISATVLADQADTPDDALIEAVRKQAVDWFGSQAQAWRPLRVVRIPYALPDQQPPHYQRIEKSVRVRDRVLICGDRYDTASINGAMRSGRRAAEAALRELSGQRAPATPE
ncbi:protoporphyrinogen/coproporphyrinogen oxidase [Botrimarina hoheduenensis]|uniref:Protoporphyrinogen oxidase n=1 Tax=Botrimarina hoheduenensis TaxID=2528000 RepID=A0A5C5WAV7_9BACT|nr:NAD(P)/FAD-dependent oxidoreductase [Botrimarina hoheduenensis]TWT46742.1 protoporphyrinogen oxidase [Botrimarina hoheduenensis]